MLQIQRAFGGLIALGASALIAAALTAGFPGAVWAKAEPGVHVDPNSPAGKEYALPVDSARRAASGDEGSGRGQPVVPGGSSNGPPGGVATSRRSTAGGSSEGALPSAAPPPAPPFGQGVGRGTGASVTPEAVRAISAAGSAGSGSTAWSLAGAGLIALLGSVLGLALRRRRASSRRA